MALIIAIGLMAINLIYLAITAMTFPGNWLMVATAAGVAWWRWDEHYFGVPMLIGIFVLAVLGEILEMVTSARQVKKSGGSKAGSRGALIGGMIGVFLGSVLIPILVVGTIIGACFGAFVGTMIFEKFTGQKSKHAVKLGAHAAKGRLFGTVYKFLCGLAIYIIIAIAALWR